MTASTPAPQDPHRPFFVIGQWKGGGTVDIWHVEEAPADPSARADAHERHAADADETFGSVNVVYASSPQDAAEQARREAHETSERIQREAAQRPGPPTAPCTVNDRKENP
ncbi:hypothetical protein ABZ379_45505 [Streptomyces canus]|uniref:hypothetical protein n=1 Tax=Streptomyces canus TaxID=58343 RepID=UPI00340AD1D5